MNLNALHKAAMSGDCEAEAELFKVLTVRFRLFAHQRVRDAETAQDIAQEALKTIAGTYREVEIHTSFASWAHKVLENRLLSFFRSQRIRSQHGPQSLADCEGMTPADTDPMLKRKLIECLRKVGRANRRFARILNMRYQGFTTSEICERLGISESNCHVLLHRARTMLEACLKKDTETP